MKKIALIFALLGLFTFGTPNVSEAGTPDCYTIVITCDDGSQHTVMVCEWDDLEAWYEILCGENSN